MPDQSPPDLGHHPSLRPGLVGGAVGDDLHQVEEGAGHVPVGQVVHLRVEADHLPGDVASPVGVDLGRDRAGLTAETAEALVVRGVSCRTGEISGAASLWPDSPGAWAEG